MGVKNKTEPIVVDVPNDTRAVNSVCEDILCLVRELSYSDDDVFAIHLSLEEAMVNAVKHGNGGDSSKKVKIQYSVTSDKLDITIQDQGEGFKPDSVPDPRCNDNIYKLGGRGLLLMNEYMDVVEYNDGGNKVHMVKNRTK